MRQLEDHFGFTNAKPTFRIQVISFHTIVVLSVTFYLEMIFQTILHKGSCTYYVITFGGPERPPPHVTL